jgi:hypothetical protein
MRAAAETVQAIFLLRELKVEPSCLFIYFFFLFRFAFFAFNQSGKNDEGNCRVFLLLRAKRRRLNHTAPRLVKRFFDFLNLNLAAAVGPPHLAPARGCRAARCRPNLRTNSTEPGSFSLPAISPGPCRSMKNWSANVQAWP